MRTRAHTHTHTYIYIYINEVPGALPNPREILDPALKEPIFSVGSTTLLQLLGWRLLPSCECT